MIKEYINLAAWYLNKPFDHPYCGIPPLIVSFGNHSIATKHWNSSEDSL